MIRSIAVLLGLYLAYTAYRCPCEVIYACKPLQTNAAALALLSITAYPVLFAST